MDSIILQTQESAVTDGDVLGRLGFAASSETGTNARLVVAKIEAVAEETFDASNNATEMVFYLAADGAAASKMTLTSAGNLNIGGELQTTNIGYTDGDNAIVIADGGGVTFPQAATFTSGLQSNGAVTVGVNDTGHDVKFFGATDGAYALFDESEDRLHLVGVNYVQEAVPANDTPTAEDATVTLDLKKGNYHNISLGENVTKFEFTNAKRGQKFILRITQNASSAKTVSWSNVDSASDGTAATVRWAANSAPTMSTDTSHTDIYGFLCTDNAGTAFDGFIIGQDLPD